jgi:hypothetical protein
MDLDPRSPFGQKQNQSTVPPCETMRSSDLTRFKDFPPWRFECMQQVSQANIYVHLGVSPLRVEATTFAVDNRRLSDCVVTTHSETTYVVTGRR